MSQEGVCTTYQMIEGTADKLNIPTLLAMDDILANDILHPMIQSQIKQQQMSLHTVHSRDGDILIFIVNLGHYDEDKYAIISSVNHKWTKRETISAEEVREKYGISGEELPRLNMNYIMTEIVNNVDAMIWLNIKQIKSQSTESSPNIDVNIEITNDEWNEILRKSLTSDELPFVFTTICGDCKWIKVIAIITENDIYYVGISCIFVDGIWIIGELYLDLSEIDELSVFATVINRPRLNRLDFVTEPKMNQHEILEDLEEKIELNQHEIDALQLNIYDVKYEDTGLELQSDWEDDDDDDDLQQQRAGTLKMVKRDHLQRLQHEFEWNQQEVDHLSAELRRYYYRMPSNFEYEDIALEVQSDWDADE